MKEIKQHKGNSKNLAVVITKKVDGNIVPFDLTGWTATLTVKENFKVSATKIQKEVTNHQDAVNGKTSFDFIPVDTENLDPKTYVFDIQLSKGNDVFTAIVGEWIILEVVK